MPVPSAVTDLSTTAASNSPASTESPGDGDDYIRALSAFIKQSYNGTLTEFVKVTSDGRLYGTALHNNSGAVTGTTNQYVASGTYTPTLTNTTNVGSSTANSSTRWIRVGNVVHVAGTVSVTPTAGSTTTELGISLPIASSLSNAIQLSGTAARNLLTVAELNGIVVGEATGDTAQLRFLNDASTAAATWYFTFTYTVL